MDFIAYDLETTGTDTRRDHIIEFGAVRFENFQPGPVFTQLVRPPVDIPKDATAVNHITNDMVAGAPPVEDVLGGFADFCADLPLVAHNAKFDFHFVKQAVTRHKSRAPQGVTLDTKSLAKKIIPGLPSYRLSSLMHYFQFEIEELHRAEADARYCGEVLAEMIRRLHRAGQPCDVADLQELSELPEMIFPQLGSSHEQLGLF